MLANLPELKAIIFDMDGVLFLSSDCHAKAFEETLAEIGVTGFSYPRVAGMRTDEAFRKLLTEENQSPTDELIQTLVAKKQHRARASLASQGKTADYSDELLELLRHRYRLALASSASRPTVEIYLQKCRYPDAFEFCLDGTCVSQAKPSPEIYLLTLEKLGLKAHECVVIEDAANGVEAAVRAGIATIAVAGEEDPDIFLQSGASVVVSGLKDVATLLHKEHRENTHPSSS